MGALARSLGTPPLFVCIAGVVSCGSPPATFGGGATGAGTGAGDVSGSPVGTSSGARASGSGMNASSAGSTTALPADGMSSASTDRFPATSILYEDVSQAPVDPNSDAIINHLDGAGGWGSGKFQIDFSLTILHADSSVTPRPFTRAAGYYTPDCDVTSVPIPPDGNAEGSTDYACTGGDCHILIYQGTRLYELYNADIAGGSAAGSPFTTRCEVVWDLTRDYWEATSGGAYSRGDQCTSADAAGMPIAPLLVTGAELKSGAVDHALRFTLPNADIRAAVYVHPGTHMGGPTGDALMPPYTSRFRLKSTFNAAGLTPGAQVVAKALQEYGMFLDDGGNIPLTVDASAAAELGSHDLSSLKVTDFEIVAAPGPAIDATGNCTRTPLTQ
jgi:hypothetical protein